MCMSCRDARVRSRGVSSQPSETLSPDRRCSVRSGASRTRICPRFRPSRLGAPDQAAPTDRCVRFVPPSFLPAGDAQF